MSDTDQFDWNLSVEETNDNDRTDDYNREDIDATEAVEANDDVETVERAAIDDRITEAVDNALAARRAQLLETAVQDKVRKAVPVLASDRKKIRRRNVDTDVAISDLAYDAVIKLLAEGDEVDVASDRAAKNRKERITLTAPSWWWSLATLYADAHNGQLSDVIASAINKQLP